MPGLCWAFGTGRSSPGRRRSGVPRARATATAVMRDFAKLIWPMRKLAVLAMWALTMRVLEQPAPPLVRAQRSKRQGLCNLRRICTCEAAGLSGQPSREQRARAEEFELTLPLSRSRFWSTGSRLKTRYKQIKAFSWTLPLIQCSCRQSEVRVAKTEQGPQS